MSTATARVIPFPRERTTTPEAAPIHVTRQGPRPGEDLLCQFVSGLYMDAAQARDRILPETSWETLPTGYWGDLWPAVLPSYKSPIVVNELKRLILSELSDLTDMLPTVYITGDPQTGQRDAPLEQAIQAYWQRHCLDMTLLEVCADAAVWPCGFFEIVWDPLAAQGQGDVVVRARRPSTVYPDPYATDDTDWRYVIVREVMDVHEVRQRWPEHGWRVQPDVTSLADRGPLGESAPWQGRGAGMVSPMFPVSAPVPSQGLDTRVSVYTCYVQDTSTHVVPGSWADSQGVIHLQRLTRRTYPHGRMIQCTSQTVLYDGPNVYKHGFPLVRLTLQPTLHSFWPRRSLVGELLELQRATDKLESLILENALRMQKAVWLVDAHAGIDPRTFADVPGQVILRTPGANIEPIRPPAMPPDLLQHPERLRTQMRTLMGQVGSRAGTPQPGNRSAELSETEISQGMGLTRLHARFLHKACMRLVEKLFATMADFYTAPRLLPCCVEEGWKPVVWQPLLDRERYSVHIDPNSFVVQSKTMVKRLALALAKMNKMPTEDLYRILEFPRGQEIAARLHDELQMAAMARQKQGGGRRGGRR